MSLRVNKRIADIDETTISSSQLINHTFTSRGSTDFIDSKPGNNVFKRLDTISLVSLLLILILNIKYCSCRNYWTFSNQNRTFVYKRLSDDPHTVNQNDHTRSSTIYRPLINYSLIYHSSLPLLIFKKKTLIPFLTHRQNMILPLKIYIPFILSF